jgi:hypothetical protein
MPAPDPAVPGLAAAAPPRSGDRVQHLARLLPEWLALATALALALDLLPAWVAASPQEIVHWVVMSEGVTLMFLCSLVDVASRLRRAPPWWAGVLGSIALLAVYPQVPALVIGALREGLWVALPFAWSVIERLRELWTLPGSSVVEKQRRRALTFGRLYSGLVLAGIFVITSFIEFLTIAPDGVAGGLVEGLGPWFLVVFFGLAAFDAWRVHRPGFAAAPRNLWPRFDGGETARLDPL